MQLQVVLEGAPELGKNEERRHIFNAWAQLHILKCGPTSYVVIKGSRDLSRDLSRDVFSNNFQAGEGRGSA